jgi:hypothetical protein
VRINRLTFYVFQRREKREGESRRRRSEPRRETLAPPFTRVLKTDPYKVPL